MAEKTKNKELHIDYQNPMVLVVICIVLFLVAKMTIGLVKNTAIGVLVVGVGGYLVAKKVYK
jgi:hypothetical protein